MSPRRLTGWEPRTYVTYVYEGDRVVGAEYVTEPEWSQADLRMVLEQDRWERSLNRNGIPLDEATSSEANPNNYGGSHHYVVGDPMVDWSERARLDAEAKYQAEHPDDKMHGLIFQPVRKDRLRTSRAV